MKKYFYSNIIDTSSISLALADIELSNEERIHLVTLAQNNIHHAILDAILSELSEEDKKEFLMHLQQDKHDKIWEFLNGKIEGIEDKIKNTADDLKKQLHQDIEESRKTS